MVVSIEISEGKKRKKMIIMITSAGKKILTFKSLLT